MVVLFLLMASVGGVVLDEGIGARLATERKIRGLTQQQLAARAHVSLSLIQAVEQGQRPATATLVAAAARALRVDRSLLTGQPYRDPGAADEAMHAGVTDLRREVAAHGLEPLEDRAAANLRERTGSASRLRQASRYGALGEVLPDLIADLRWASFTTDGEEHQRVAAMLAEAYDAGRQLAWKLGYLDLAHELATLYREMARTSEDPLAIEVGEAMRAHDLIATGDYDLAHHVVTRSLDRLDQVPESHKQRSVRGYMMLEGALVAARQGRDRERDDYHGQAERLAERTGHDRDDYRLAFGPTNCRIWAVGLAVEALDGRQGVAKAGLVSLPVGTPAERAGHHWIDVARAYLLIGEHGSALDALWQARQVAPEHTRSHPMARETVYALARKERRATDSLRGLAVWLGIND